MTLHAKVTLGGVLAATMCFLPALVQAQDNPAPENIGIFAFSGISAPALDDLPLTVAPEDGSTPKTLAVTDLGISTATPTDPAQSERILITNSWAIGVYR